MKPKKEILLRYSRYVIVDKGLRLRKNEFLMKFLEMICEYRRKMCKCSLKVNTAVTGNKPLQRN